MATLNDLLKRQEKRVLALETLNQLSVSDPEFLAEIVAEISKSGRVGGGLSRRAAPDDSVFEVVKKVLENRGNEWTDNAVLMEAGKLTKPQLAYVLRRTHEEKFEKRPHPDHGKKIQWRLKAVK